MKVRTPKVWESLPAAQREKIEAYCREVATEAARMTTERDARLMLDIYIKMVCWTLHEVFGFGEKRLTMFLVNHSNLFWDQKRRVADGTQVAFLNETMAGIFRKNGFPQRIFDKMLGALDPVFEEG